MSENLLIALIPLLVVLVLAWALILFKPKAEVSDPLPEAAPAREPHDGWMNAWLFTNIPRDQNCNYLWNAETRKMAGDWADFRLSQSPASTPAPQPCEMCKKWEHEFNMYRTAWLREIGGIIRKKSHEIDGFVLRTRELFEQAKKWANYENGLLGKDPFWMPLADSTPPQPVLKECPICFRSVDMIVDTKAVNIGGVYYHGPCSRFSASTFSEAAQPTQCPTCGSDKRDWRRCSRCEADGRGQMTSHEFELCNDKFHEAAQPEPTQCPKCGSSNPRYKWCPACHQGSGAHTSGGGPKCNDKFHEAAQPEPTQCPTPSPNLCSRCGTDIECYEVAQPEPGKEGDAHATIYENPTSDVTRGQSEREQNETGGSSFNEAEERGRAEIAYASDSTVANTGVFGIYVHGWLAARRLAKPELERKNELLIQTIEQLQKDKAAAEAEVQRCIKCREIVEEANDKLEAEVLRLRETNRELNRRNQSLDHALAAETGKKAWYGYYKAALTLYRDATGYLDKLDPTWISKVYAPVEAKAADQPGGKKSCCTNPKIGICRVSNCPHEENDQCEKWWHVCLKDKATSPEQRKEPHAG